MTGLRNIFSIGRERRNEDQLTEMLVWLVDAVPDVGRAIVRFAFQDQTADHGIEVTTQHGVAGGRLDALFVGPSFALVVESKIDSGFGADQVTRYLEWLHQEHQHRERRALMTLTARSSSWRDEDVVLADRLGIRRCVQRWEELHDVLGPLAASSGEAELASRLVTEFLNMLSEEGLVRMKPLDVAELPRWPEALQTVQRFHAFFRACVEPIGDAFGIKPGNAYSTTNPEYAYQEYRGDDGRVIAVGIQASDDGQVRVARHVPIFWVQVQGISWSDWPELARQLEQRIPDGWRPMRTAGGRKRIWRYLDEVVEAGTFEEQRDAIVTASLVAGEWLERARQNPVSVEE
jgi:hypothetical protein